MLGLIDPSSPDANKGLRIPRVLLSPVEVDGLGRSAFCILFDAVV